MPRWRLTQRQREELAGYAFIAPWLVGFLVFTAGAMVYALMLSFYRANMLTPPRYIGLDNYQRLLADPLFFNALFNTAYYTFVGVPLRMAGGLALALMLNRSLPGLGLFRTIYYLPMVVAGVAVSILWVWLYHPTHGIFNYALRLVGLPTIPWLFSETWVMPALIIMSLWYLGENMIIYLAGLKGIPEHLYEAAAIDGARTVQCFRHITLPLMTPTLFFTLVTGIIWSFQVFTQSFVMTRGGPNNASLTYVLYLYQTAFQKFQMGYASALAWVLLVLVMAATLLIFKSSPAWVYYEGELRKR